MGTQLLVVAGLSLTMLLLTGGISWLSMGRMAKDAARMFNETTVPMQYLSEMNRLAWEIRSHVLLHIVAPDAWERQQREAAIQQAKAELKELQAQYESTSISEAARNGLAKFNHAWSEYVTALETVIHASASGDKDLAMELAYSGAGGIRFAEAAASLENLVTINTEMSGNLYQGIKTSGTAARTSIGLLVLIAVAITLTITLLVTRRIARGVTQVAEAARRLAQGDLTVEQLAIHTRDEIGQMGAAFNQMAANLRRVMQGVASSAQSIATMSQELAATSAQSSQGAHGAAQAVSQVADGATEQAQASDEMRQTIEKLQQTVEQIASGAQTSAGEVQAASQLLRDVFTAIEDVAKNAQLVAVHAVWNGFPLRLEKSPR